MIELLEHTLNLVRRDAAPGIRHAYHHRACLGQVRRHRYAPAARGEFDGVMNQVGQDLMQFVLVALDGRKRARVIHV